MTMRPASLAVAVALCLCGTAALAQQTGARPPAPPLHESPPPAANPLLSEAEASRQRTEAREREWDRRMRASTSSICNGC